MEWQTRMCRNRLQATLFSSEESLIDEAFSLLVNNHYYCCTVLEYWVKGILEGSHSWVQDHEGYTYHLRLFVGKDALQVGDLSSFRKMMLNARCWKAVVMGVCGDLRGTIG